MLKKCKKLISLGMMLLLLLPITVLPNGEGRPVSGDPENGTPPISVCSPDIGDDEETRS